MTTKDNKDILEIKHLLTSNLVKLEARMTAIEVSAASEKRQMEVNCVEIAGLRKANVVWSSINSALIAIGGSLMLILKGS